MLRLLRAILIGSALLRLSPAMGYDISTPDVPVTESFTAYAGSTVPAGWTCGLSTTFLGLDPGTNQSGGWRCYGTSGSTDRAFGYLGNSTYTTGFMSSVWTNLTGGAIDMVSISYRAERWRQGPRTSLLEVAYSIGGLTFSNVAALTFVAPDASTNTSATDGNDPANSAVRSVTLSNLAWNAGQALHLRWTYDGGSGSGSRQGLAIDDVTVTAGVPAPPAPMVRFLVSETTLPEDAGTALVWVAGSALVDPVTALVTVAGGSASPGVDFAFSGTTLVLNATSPSQVVQVVIADDALVEATESVVMALSAIGATADPASSTTTVSIADNDLPVVHFNPATNVLMEGGSSATIAILLSIPASATVQVQAAGSATMGSDFTMSATQFVFAATGTTVRTLTLSPVNDAQGEGTEETDLSFSLLSGVVPGEPAVARVVILDNDSLPAVNFSPAADVMEEGDTSAVLRVVLTAPQNVTVQVAGAGTELSMPGGTTLVFSASGPATQLLTVVAAADGLVEGPERLTLSLVPGPQANPGSNSTASVLVRDGDSLSLMAANITSGTGSAYEEAGQRIFRGLLPDVVAIQEFTMTGGTHRAFVDRNFGTGYSYYVESQPSDSKPNGIVSRWPIVASGEWTDSVVPDRDFAWATIDLPGSRNLHVVSVHLYSSGTATDRRNEASVIVSQIQSNFPASDYIAVAGDFNTVNRSESALTTFGTILSDARKPADQATNRNTNANRDKPYDYVLPNAALNALHTNVVLGGRSFPEGLVFDSTLWSPPPAPVLVSDSSTNGMQHMAVLKWFSLPAEQPTNPPVLGLSPIFHDFGEVTTGATAQIQFTVFNAGALPLTGTGRVVGSRFTVVGPSNFTVAGGASTTLAVRFQPLLLQAYTGSLVIASNGGSDSSDLSGTGAPLLLGYDLWAAQFAEVTQRAVAADADADGWANLLEYATGGSAATNDAPPLWIALDTNQVPRPCLHRDTNATDVILVVETAGLLTNWLGLATNMAGQWNAGAGVVESGSNPVTAVLGADADSSNRAVRLRVIRP